MPLLLEQLLDDPGLRLELVAGRAGLRERPIRWAHISEIPDPTPWLEGGELVLTTGLAIKDDPTLQRRLVARLSQRGCAALGFGLGIWVHELPPALAEEADARLLPLFTVPYEVPFIAVTKRVMHHVAAEHYATLRAAVDLHRQVLAAVISGDGIEAVLATVGRHLPDFGVEVRDYYGQALARHDPTGAIATLGADRLWELAAPRHHGRRRFEIPTGGQVVTGAVVRVGEEVQGVLALVGPRGLHEHEALLLEQALAGVSLELARGQSARQARRERVDDLLEDAAGGRAGPRDLERRIAKLGLDPSQGIRVLCVRGPATAGARGLCGLVEDVAGGALVGRLDGVVHALVAPRDGGQAERLVDAARARGWAGLVVGRSRVHPLDQLAAALKEAVTAAEAPGADAVRDVGDLGLRGLLAVADTAAVESFVTEVLGPVLSYDRTETTSLAETLRAYLRHGCRPGPAAAELRIHRHTLSYRLDRVRDLTGRDPRDGANLLAFTLALELDMRERTAT